MTPTRNFRASVNAFTCTQGYTIRMARFTGGCKYLLNCDRGGTPRSQLVKEKRKGKEIRKEWTVSSNGYDRVKKDNWHSSFINGELNHPPTLDIVYHAAARLLNK